jgi:Sel1 repeat
MTWRQIALVLIASTVCLTATAETAYNLGVEAWKHKKYEEAARQWILALPTGNVNALNNLGYLYSTGKGVTKDPSRAFQLWTVAARYGHSESQWHIGYAYEHGEGVNQDLIYAYAWYRCAKASASRLKQEATSGTEQAIEDDVTASIRDLEPQLSTEALAHAQDLAQRLIDRYGKASP